MLDKVSLLILEAVLGPVATSVSCKLRPSLQAPVTESTFSFSAAGSVEQGTWSSWCCVGLGIVTKFCIAIFFDIWPCITIRIAIYRFLLKPSWTILPALPYLRTKGLNLKIGTTVKNEWINQSINMVATGQGKVREKIIVSRSGKSQGISKFIRENENCEKSQGEVTMVRENCDSMSTIFVEDQ